MGTTEIIREIEHLPISKRRLIVKKVLKSMRTTKKKNGMQKAVDVLMSDYKTDNELTAFQEFILSGPVMSEEQHNIFIENRKSFDRWRRK